MTPSWISLYRLTIATSLIPYILLQESLWRGSSAGMPSCRCQPSARCLAQRTVPWAPGPPGPSAPTPAPGKTQRANRPERGPSWLTTLEKVRHQNQNSFSPTEGTYNTSCSWRTKQDETDVQSDINARRSLSWESLWTQLFHLICISSVHGMHNVMIGLLL